MENNKVYVTKRDNLDFCSIECFHFIQGWVSHIEGIQAG